MPALSNYNRETIRDHTGAFFCFHETFSGVYPVSKVFIDRRKKNRPKKDQPAALSECSNELIFQSLRSDLSAFIISFLGMRDFLAKRLYQVPQVLKVYSKFEHDVFYTWVVTDERDLEAQRLVYDIEDELIEWFPEFEFDFYTVYALGRDPDLLVDSTLALEKPSDV